MFQVLIWSVFTVFANVPFAYTLLAAGGEKPYLYSALAGAVVNVACNLILIPSLHLLAPAVSTLASEVVVRSMLGWYSRRVARIPVGRILLSGGIASLVMFYALMMVSSRPFLAQLAIGAAAYVAGLVLVGGIRAGDIKLIREAMRT